MEESICPTCLYNNRVTSKFCQSCGKPLWLRDRYLLQAIVEQNSNQAVYAALDKSRCGSPGCGAWIEDTAIPDCSICESSPYPWSPCEIYKRNAPPGPQQAELEIMGYWFYDEKHEAWFGVTRPRWGVDWFPNGQRVSVAGATDKGQVYDHNEDALLLQVTTCYFNSVPFDVAILAIADGIGGHEGGEAASKTAVTGLLSAVFPLLVEGFNPVGNSPNKAGLKDLFRQAVLQANQAVFHQHQALQSDLGAALTAVWLVKGLALVANVGDSRTYLYRGGKLRQITTDHSLVYRKMLNQEISRDDIYTHPQRNVIYRSLGEKEVVDVDTFAVELEPGDLLVLCCDGLWEMVRDEELEQVLARETDLQTACRHLVQRAYDAGGEDNISIILARVQPI